MDISVGIIMGSRSDWSVMAAAADMLDALVFLTKPRSFQHTERQIASTLMRGKQKAVA